jgi:hypothetical protein
MTTTPTAVADPPSSDRNPGLIVATAVDSCLEIAESWLGWDGRPVHRGENVWTPHKALRRITDHLIDHLAEVEALLAGVPTIPDRWHGRAITLDSDWARFTEPDLDEARPGWPGSVSSIRCAIPQPARRPGTPPAARPGRCRSSPSTSPKWSGTPSRWGLSARPTRYPDDRITPRAPRPQRV